MNDNYFLSYIKQYKGFFLLGGGVLLIVLVLLIALAQGLRSQNADIPPSTETPDVTPAMAKENLTILTVTPKNNTKSASVFEKVSITFSRPVNTFEKSSIFFSAEPDIKGEKLWSLEQNVLTITPSEPLLNNQQYLLKVRYFDQQFIWSFTTVLLEEMSTEDQIQIQAKGDSRFNEIQEKIDATYPWLGNLPLQEQNYFVYFHVDQKQMVANLYPSTASETPVPQQIETMKTEILSRLQRIGVDIVKYPPKWVSKPEP